MRVERGTSARVERQIAVERGFVDEMYGRLDSGIADALGALERLLATPASGPQSRYDRDVEAERLTRVVRDLRAAERSLCFGRIDDASGASVHIGRIGLRSPDGDPLLVDWRAGAARPFYAATPAAPLGVRRRRHLRLEGRRVTGVSDEILDGSAPTSQDVIGEGPLAAELGRARTGRMREAAATLQAEQDAIVRSPNRGVTVVDGGPGTGKTLVALHRAAYVLYSFPAVADRGVLVFGPNRRFLDYISDVLPSLGENDVRLATASDLTGTEPTADEPDAAARVKGRGGFAEALARWVRARQPRGEPLAFEIGQDAVVLDAERVEVAWRHAVQGERAHNPARAVFKEHVVGDLVDLLERRTSDALAQMDDEVAAMLGTDLDKAVGKDLRALGFDDTVATEDPEIDWDGIRDGLLDDPGVERVIESVWPRLRAGGVLRRFLADRGALTTVPGLTGEEAALPCPPGDAGYTHADLALLDEVRALVDGPPPEVYGHIVVDEAQELSEMQWRMLMRRCPTRSLTVVGDFAQAGSATTIRSWIEALDPFIGERFEHHTLTVNYRTTAEVLEAAAPLLARIAPGQRISRSIRHGERPRTVEVPEPSLETVVRDLVRETARANPGELIGVIAPPARIPALTRALAGTAAAAIPATEARGLEFDRVFVADPAGIEATRNGGIRDLYVASTRATKSLVTLELRPE